jgi:hypothetical protein
MFGYKNNVYVFLKRENTRMLSKRIPNCYTHLKKVIKCVKGNRRMRSHVTASARSHVTKADAVTCHEGGCGHMSRRRMRSHVTKADAVTCH